MVVGNKLVREVGNWVDGDKFVGRELELTQLTELLDEGANVLLAAPRRTGKTSLMRETLRRLDDRYNCVFVDLERASGPVDAIVDLALAAQPHQRVGGRIRAWLERVVPRREPSVEGDLRERFLDAITGDWPAKGDRLLDDLAEAELPTIVFLDEVPILLSRMLYGGGRVMSERGRNDVDAFVSWLRAAAQRHRGRVRFVVSGSIGLAPLLGRARLSATINYLTPFRLGPWDRQTADACLAALANNYGIELELPARERACERLGACVPYYVQLFFSELLADARTSRRTLVTLVDVDRVYETRLCGGADQASLKHHVERLEMVLGEDTSLAVDLLSAAATSLALGSQEALELAQRHPRGGEDPADTLREVMAVLEHDGYLERRGLGHVFVSTLLRDWWAKRYCAEAGATANRRRR